MPPTSIDSSAAIAIPWGDAGRITLELPPGWPADVVWPDLTGAIEDYPGALSGALDALEGSSLTAIGLRRGDAGRAVRDGSGDVDDEGRGGAWGEGEDPFA